jgi:hypothetical protein
MGNSKFEFRPIGSFRYIVGYCLESEEASEGHCLVETVTVNKQIGTQVTLTVREKQQLLTTINKQKRIISVFVSRELWQVWTFRGPPT